MNQTTRCSACPAACQRGLVGELINCAVEDNCCTLLTRPLLEGIEARRHGMVLSSLSENATHRFLGSSALFSLSFFRPSRSLLSLPSIFISLLSFFFHPSFGLSPFLLLFEFPLEPLFFILPDLVSFVPNDNTNVGSTVTRLEVNDQTTSVLFSTLLTQSAMLGPVQCPQ